tara:strand:- start:701 stop:868 length:168 start_codon:yes stop_codon:yes gene_type:complete
VQQGQEVILVFPDLLVQLVHAATQAFQGLSVQLEQVELKAIPEPQDQLGIRVFQD